MNSCVRCLLSTEVPGVSIDQIGICSVCRDYDSTWGNWDNIKKERYFKLENIIQKARSKKQLYDVLVPLSGGKDSTYVLYVCRKKFNLKCLAVTWDNGFLTDHARINIHTACSKLGVDHLYYGLSEPLLMDLYRHFFLNTGFFCPVCLKGIYTAIFRAQAAFNIPLTIKGTSKRTEEHVHPAYFIDGNFSFLENVLENTPLKKEAEVIIQPIGLFSSPMAINLPDYMDWDYDLIFQTITERLGWMAHSPDAEHSDCKVDNIVHYFRYKKYPALIPEMLRYSKLVTCGQLDKKEAERRVAEKKASLKEPSNLSSFLNALGISRDEMDGVLLQPMRHMKYLKERSRVVRRLKVFKKRLLPGL
jgi:predicted PP-loop superfamily ATPase